jgi:hypothetical protein
MSACCCCCCCCSVCHVCARQRPLVLHDVPGACLAALAIPCALLLFAVCRSVHGGCREVLTMGPGAFFGERNLADPSFSWLASMVSRGRVSSCNTRCVCSVALCKYRCGISFCCVSVQQPGASYWLISASAG